MVAYSLFPGQSPQEELAGVRPTMALERREGKTVFFLNIRAVGVLVPALVGVLELASVFGLGMGSTLPERELKEPVECL